MSLIQLKKRPLDRESQTFRDDRLIIIACDDTYAPKQYFSFFKIPRLQIVVIEAPNGQSSSNHVLQRLDEFSYEEDDERWLVLDTDHNISGTHQKTFTATLQAAKQKNINVALSRSCFEIWLLFHYLTAEEIAPLGTAKEVEQKLKGVLGAYDKTKLQFKDFPIHKLKEAITLSKAHDLTVGGGDIPTSTTTRVYKIWESIFNRLDATTSLYKELQDTIGT